MYFLFCIAAPVIFCVYTRVCDAYSTPDGDWYEGWAPSQYKDRLIYVWRFPC